MNNSDVKGFLYDMMPDDEWVTMDWAYQALREKYGARFTTPIKLFMWLINEGKADRRQITRNENNRMVAEFKKRISQEDGGVMPIKIRHIQEAVSEVFGMEISDLCGNTKFKAFCFPRQVAYYLCRTFTNASFPLIGREFGGRDHTTIIHGIKTVESYFQDYDKVAHLFNLFENKYQSYHKKPSDVGKPSNHKEIMEEVD